MPRRFILAFVFIAAIYGQAPSTPAPGTPAASAVQPCRVAVLSNGFSIPYSRREAADSGVRLWLCVGTGSGYVEIPGGQIDHIEEAEAPAALGSAAPAGSAAPIVQAVLPIEDPIRALIAGAASRHRIDPDFVASVVKAESGFNPAAVSPKGAKGLMQLMPQTAISMGVNNVLDPAANLEGGARYLRQLLDQYDGNAVKALAAYNAGPQRVEQYNGIPPYAETRKFVAGVIHDYNSRKRRQQAEPTAGVK